MNATSFWRRRCVPTTTSTFPPLMPPASSFWSLLLDEARQHRRSLTGKSPKRSLQILEVLLGEDRGRREEGDLLARMTRP